MRLYIFHNGDQKIFFFLLYTSLKKKPAYGEFYPSIQFENILTKD